MTTAADRGGLHRTLRRRWVRVERPNMTVHAIRVTGSNFGCGVRGGSGVTRLFPKSQHPPFQRPLHLTDDSHTHNRRMYVYTIIHIIIYIYECDGWANAYARIPMNLYTSFCFALLVYYFYNFVHLCSTPMYYIIFINTTRVHIHFTALALILLCI